jgi:hypothetical protein
MYTIKQIKNKLLIDIGYIDVEARSELKIKMSKPFFINLAIDHKEMLHFKDNTLIITDNLIEIAFTKSEKLSISNIQRLEKSLINKSYIPNINDRFIEQKNKETKEERDIIRKKAIKKSQSLMQVNVKKTLVDLKECLNGKKNFVIFDIEALESNHDIMLEVGILESKEGKIELKHYIIEENNDIRNGKYVPDNKDNFNFGKSVLTSQEKILKHLSEILNKADFIIGHNIACDFKMLNKYGFSDSYSNIIDTASLSKFINVLEGKKSQTKSIENCLKFFKSDYSNLHNAGNDCHYNYVILKDLYSHINKSLNDKTKKRIKSPS